MKAAILILLASLVSAQAYGCRTEPYQRVMRDFDSYFNRADLVLTAEVIEAGDIENYSQVVLVKPIEIWKGQSLEVYPIANRVNTSCSRPFSLEGGPYIIFATWLADLNMYQIDMTDDFFPAAKDKDYSIQKNLNRITSGSN